MGEVGEAGEVGEVSESEAILGRVMLAFEGMRLPARIADRLARAPAAGMTLFRYVNVETPGQVRELTEAFQRAGAARAGGGAGSGVHAGGHAGGRASGSSPMLVAADQEGGQLVALGEGTTAFAGNMALGAVDDIDLTERVGRAIGLEARAMGVNVVYAPCLDLATNPANPALGIRSFGDDPAAVARHGVAMVRGLQSAGVAAAAKHAPGMGHIATDTHHGIAVVDAPRDVLDGRDFVPFRAVFAAGVRMAMSGHLSLPGVTGRRDLPATLSRAVMTDLLRRDLGFEGVTISDALDMAALAQGSAQAVDIVAAIRAGVDLLLASPDAAALDRIEDTLLRAAARELFEADEVAATERRVAALRAWLGEQGSAPDLAVIGSAEHRALERELAARSMTLVCDPRQSVGGGLRTAARVVAIMPKPADLTPADTSSRVPPGLAAALRRYHGDVDEIIVEQQPDPSGIAAVRERVGAADLAVIGTIDAVRQPEQRALVEASAATGVPVIAVALRGPWDVGSYPPGVAALATYGILPASLEALAAVLAGDAPAPGRLPVAIPRSR